jgi:hypothetical protein
LMQRVVTVVCVPRGLVGSWATGGGGAATGWRCARAGGRFGGTQCSVGHCGYVPRVTRREPALPGPRSPAPAPWSLIPDPLSVSPYRFPLLCWPLPALPAPTPFELVFAWLLPCLLDLRSACVQAEEAAVLVAAAAVVRARSRLPCLGRRRPRPCPRHQRCPPRCSLALRHYLPVCPATQPRWWPCARCVCSPCDHQRAARYPDCLRPVLPSACHVWVSAHALAHAWCVCMRGLFRGAP